ncbi:hypothetical protein C8F04DRAFT_1259941 [Mycena alexandri]|uniref:Uncharacterized protein n=1 Tax=Mycena alexandri TaxID=1745969 RepID=A0AAD6SWM8_9AGAR|nr:hypothetical protein C8F04DRAFT_1259941 [Mycena alexandri]
MEAIWMASPPPPFPPSSFIDIMFLFLQDYSYGAGRTQYKSPTLCCTDPLNLKATFQGIGLGLGLPVQREYTLSGYAASISVEECETSSIATWGISDMFSSFVEAIFSVWSPPRSPESVTPDLREILPHVFTSTVLSPIFFRRPDPPTPETTRPNSLRFEGIPVYTLPSPVLPLTSGKRARCRPSPRRPRTCAVGGEIKSPILEYHASTGTTPYDRHGWDVMESFNASRGGRKPFAPNQNACPLPVKCPDCRRVKCTCPYGTPRVKQEHEDYGPAPKLPWMRHSVNTAPYTRLTPSPTLPSVIPRSPRPENHHWEINRYQSERVRRRLMTIEFREPWAPVAPGQVEVVRTPEEEKAHRRRWLAREENVAKRERRRWWHV